MSFIRTVLGDVDQCKIGITYSHEHIVIDQCYATDLNPEFVLNDFDKLLQELRVIKELDANLLIDTMPVNAGRNPVLSARLSRESGLHIVVPTGIHLEQYYPSSHWRYKITEHQLTQLFIDDIEKGIDRYDYNGPIVERTEHRAGLIKLATGDGSINAHQEMIFNAVVNAHLVTGAPILTHTNNGTLAMEQIERFFKLGADLNHVVLSHLDRNMDMGYHKAVFDSGVNVEYDSAFRWKANIENNTYRLLEKYLPLFPNQITVGMDAARNKYWSSYGGAPGLSYLLTVLVDKLKSMGLNDFIDNIFIENPRKIFTFKNDNITNDET
jgi:5-phospho-D-xylono-1,4-lactonase